MELGAEYLIDIVDRALTEDVDTGDVTTLATIDPVARGRGVIIAKADGVISGLDLAALVFYRLDDDSEFATGLKEGSPVRRGQRLVEIKAKQAALLTGERTALNFLMHLSGIATTTARYAALVAGTRCTILDTRKTAPGLRLLEKRAVASGGGGNHRLGLHDMILIKDNHIIAAGSIPAAVAGARAFAAQHTDKKLAIEVETQTLVQVREAAATKVDRIMLDNFSIENTRVAVQMIRAVDQDVEIEASGNMTLDVIADYAATGVDFISVGAITHSAPWLDLSMEIELR